MHRTFENILRFKRGFFVGRCESSCANVCSIDCDRIRNLILPPEVSENDRTTENARNILLVIYEYQKKYLSKRPQGDNSRATCTSERVPRGKSKTVVTTSTSAGCPYDAVQYKCHLVNILLLPIDDFQLQRKSHGDQRNVASDYDIIRSTDARRIPTTTRATDPIYYIGKCLILRCKSPSAGCGSVKCARATAHVNFRMARKAKCRSSGKIGNTLTSDP